MSENDATFMRRAIALARTGMDGGQGGPFGCVVVKDGSIIGEGSNQVTSTNDPSAHAEIVAIRAACRALKDFQLTGCEIYTTCEPCPMCMGAIYWARPSKVYYACSRQDAADAGFDDSMIYEELAAPADKRKIPMSCIAPALGSKLFDEWIDKSNKTRY